MHITAKVQNAGSDTENVLTVIFCADANTSTSTGKTSSNKYDINDATAPFSTLQTKKCEYFSPQFLRLLST